jgi:predicted RNA binding protein with dsRBD fold (UPF0201 family)
MCIVLGLVGAAAGGCAAPAIVATAGLSVFQASTTAYINGELEFADAVPMEVMYHSTLAAMEELRFDLQHSHISERSATVSVREQEGRRIRIYLEEKSAAVTKVNIRVGVFGDRAMSQLVQVAINSHRPEEFEVPPLERVRRRREFDFPQ